MKVRRSLAGAALAAILSLSVLSAGCYGKFQLTRMIHDLNQSVEEKYTRSAVTWALLLPYGFAAFIDFTVFNLVEFWTGENPLVVTKVHREGADTVSMTLYREGKGTAAVLDRFREGRRVSTLVVRDGGEGVVRASLFEGGALTRDTVARTGADGSVTVEGNAAGGAFSGRYLPCDLSSLRARVGSLLSPAERG
jgi:hypothetical protein